MPLFLDIKSFIVKFDYFNIQFYLSLMWNLVLIM